MRLSGTKTGAVNQYRGLGNQLWDLAGNRPSLDLPFSDTKSLVDTTTGTNLIDFTRASSGTYVGSDGLIKTATTNLLTYSEEFDDASWGLTNILAFGSGSIVDSTTSPDGLVAADKVTEDLATGFHRIGQQFSHVAGTTYTFTVFVKAAERTKIHLQLSANLFKLALFDLTTGTTANPDASIVNYGDGWYRCSLTNTATTTSTASVFVEITDDSSNRQYTGDGTSGIYIWGAQLEQSSTVGEYVKTTSTINSAPRFDHDPTTGESLGLLVEESRTNYLIGSESFAGWTVSGQGFTQSTAGSIVAPNGQSGAVQLFTEDLTTGVHRIFIAPSTGQLTQTHSVFVKAAAGTREIYLSSDGPTGTRQNITFDLQTGSFVSSTGDWSNPFITPYPNGWYRIGGTITDNGSSTLFIIGLTDGAISYPGDGTSSIYLWGAQLEEGSFPTSYIKTEGSTVTRAADVASISGSNFSSWYRQDEGTVFAEHSWQTDSEYSTVWGVSDGTIDNEIRLIGWNNGVDRAPTIVAGSVPQVSGTNRFYSGNTNYKYAITLKQDSVASCRNGDSPLVDSSATLPLVSTLSIGSTRNTAFFLDGRLKRLTYWPTRLPNETLQGITQQ